MRTCLAMCALLWLTLPASAESRAGTYTPQQLHDQSTVVFEGTVTRVETVAKYHKAFPVRAKVAAVLKGKLDGKDVSFRYKHPGRSVIREAEFNKPAVAQKGTFYLKDFSGTLVLIGYIVKPAAAPAVAARPFGVVVDGPLIEKGNGWQGAVFTPDGRRIIHRGVIYDAKTGAILRRIKGYPAVYAPSAVSPDGKTVAFRVSGYRGPGKTQQWHGVSVASVETGRILKTVEIVDQGIRQISFPSQRRVVAVAVRNVYVIDLQLGRANRVHKLADHHPTAVSPDGKLYAKSHIVSRPVKGVAGKSDSMSTRFFVTIHDLETGKETARLGETEGYASRMMWTPDGEHIVVTTPLSQMMVFHVPTRKLLATHVDRWEPALSRQMVDRRFLLIDKPRGNAFLDLKTQDILPIEVPAQGRVWIAAISPDGTRAVVGRHGLPVGGVPVYLARLERIRAPARPAAQPVLGGKPVKGLRISLAAMPDVFLTGFSIGQLDLTVTFTNVSDRPIKWTRWMLRYVPRLIGPDGRPLTPRKRENRAHFVGPREADVKTLAPGRNISFILKEFPRFTQWNDEEHFDLSKPGRYRLRLTYTSKLRGSPWPAGFKECWQGTVTTNEVAIDVMNGQDKGPHPVGPLVRMLRFEKHPLWAATNLARDAKAGLPAVTAVFKGAEHWTVRVRAAGGLMDAESKASPDLKRKAEMFLLKSLTADYTAAGLRSPYFYLRPTDEGLRWLLDRAGKANASRILRRQAMMLLSLRSKGLGPEARRLFLGGLAGKAIQTRRHAMVGLDHLGLKEGELALYRRLATDADLVVRRRLFQALAHKPDPWAMPLIVAGLRSDDEDVRRSCAWGIRNRKDKSLAPELIRLLKESPHNVRGNFPQGCYAACMAIVALFDLKGYEFDDNAFHYNSKAARRECARLLKWWDARRAPATRPADMKPMPTVEKRGEK